VTAGPTRVQRAAYRARQAVLRARATGWPSASILSAGQRAWAQPARAGLAPARPHGRPIGQGRSGRAGGLGRGRDWQSHNGRRVAVRALPIGRHSRAGRLVTLGEQGTPGGHLALAPATPDAGFHNVYLPVFTRCLVER
jgi:hypothetical protein